MFDPENDLDNEVPVFTQYEAWTLAFAVAHFLVDDPDFDEVSEFIEGAVPQVLSR